MIETHFFYTILMLFMIMFSSVRVSIAGFDDKAAVQANWKVGMYFVIIVYSFLIGMRYLVGVDYATYLGWYKEVLATGSFPIDEKKEMGYISLNLILAYFNTHYSGLFVVLAFLQILFICRIFKYIPIVSRWYILFFFTTLMMFSSMNIMRQTLAYFIFFNVILAVNNKQYKQAIFLCVLGFSFHKTILVPLLLLPLLKYEWFKNRNLQYMLLISFTVFTQVYLNFFLETISPIVTLLGYNYYLDNIDSMYELTADITVGAGFGIYLFFFIDIVIIYFSKSMKIFFEKYQFYKFYNLYFVGILLDNLFRDNFVLSRSNDYLLNFRVLMLSFLACYLLKVKLKYSFNYILLSGIVIALLAYYFRGIENSAAKCSPIQFVF